MKSFLQYITEDTDPYDWDTGYGKRFKWVRTPPGAQTPPQTQPTVSLVTPANKDAWDWPEVDTEQLAKLAREPDIIAVRQALHELQQEFNQRHSPLMIIDEAAIEGTH